MTCDFCTKIENKERQIIENDLAWAFPTNLPIVPGHTLITSKRCVSMLDDLAREEIDAILDLRRKIKPALAKVFGAQGFNYAWNEGEVAGQTVPHIHLHMLPRKEGDTGVWKYDPREFLYRLGSREESPQAELLAVAKEIKNALE